MFVYNHIYPQKYIEERSFTDLGSMIEYLNQKIDCTRFILSISTQFDVAWSLVKVITRKDPTIYVWSQDFHKNIVNRVRIPSQLLK